MIRKTGWLALVLLTSCWEAAAQPATPIGPFVVDLRGTLARFKQDGAVAGTIGVQPTDLPTRGLGIGAGAHWYPARRRGITLGVGAEMLAARDGRAVENRTTQVTGPTLTSRLSSLAPQVSLNFGTGDGWSYISAGMGLARMTVERSDVTTAAAARRTRTLNYGGGARWFTGPHLAFTFDVRFYSIGAPAASTGQAEFPKTKLMVISAGVAFK